MCFRIKLYFFFICLIITYSKHCVDGKVSRPKKESSESGDSSKSFGDAFQAFLSNLFGSTSNETEVTSEPLSDNLGGTTPGYSENMSDISPELDQNSTNTVSDLNLMTNVSLTNNTNSSTNANVVPELELSENSTNTMSDLNLLTNASRTNNTNSSTNADVVPESELNENSTDTNTDINQLADISQANITNPQEDTKPEVEKTTPSKSENNRCYYDTHLKVCYFPVLLISLFTLYCSYNYNVIIFFLKMQ